MALRIQIKRVCCVFWILKACLCAEVNQCLCTALWISNSFQQSLCSGLWGGADKADDALEPCRAPATPKTPTPPCVPLRRCTFKAEKRSVSFSVSSKMQVGVDFCNPCFKNLTYLTKVYFDNVGKIEFTVLLKSIMIKQTMWLFFFLANTF